MRCPIVFRGPNGAASRVGAQHSQNYGPWYAAVPGLIVIAPYSAADAKGLLKAAIQSEDPVVFLENELLYGQSFDVPKLDDYTLPIGKARVVRAGKDVTLVSYSIGVGVALDAAAKLAEEGIDAEVIDLRTLRPLDKATVLASLAKTNRMVCVEEGWPVCSISAELIAVAMEEGFDDLDAPGAARHRRGRAAALRRQSREAGADQGRRRRRGGEEGLLPLTGELDADRRLALAYASVRARPALEALWRLDVTLGAVLATGREPMVSRIRLAWWREALEAARPAPPPPEPVLQGARRPCPSRRHHAAPSWRRWRRAGSSCSATGPARRRAARRLCRRAGRRAVPPFGPTARPGRSPGRSGRPALGAGRSRPPQRRPRRSGRRARRGRADRGRRALAARDCGRSACCRCSPGAIWPEARTPGNGRARRRGCCACSATGSPGTDRFPLN